VPSHTATLLSNGTVLIAGGGDNNGYFGSVRSTIPLRADGRQPEHDNSRVATITATLLKNGTLLVAVGAGGAASAEIYDPLWTWSLTGSMSSARSSLHSRPLLPSGTVLAAGGVNGALFSRQELYDPASGTWSITGSMTSERADMPLHY